MMKGNTMTIKQMAILRVAKIMAIGLAMGLVFNLGLHYLGIVVMGTLVTLALLVYFAKFAYDIELQKLESQNALTKIKEQQ